MPLSRDIKPGDGFTIGNTRIRVSRPVRVELSDIDDELPRDAWKFPATETVAEQTSVDETASSRR